MEKNVDILICGAAHSLVLPHKYDKVPISDLIINDESSVDHGKYGLFNVTTPNLNTYYPDVKPEDLRPEEGEFIFPIFRLLSEVVVNKMSSPVDFRSQGVLKDSAPLLVGQTVYTEHEQIIGNHIGVVMETYWQDSYTTKGIKVPAGINGILKLDGKSNPKIARGILQDPPAIHSASVSVMYRWAKSHNIDDFFDKLGTFNDKGELIRKIATEIILYQELSLVPHGADPFAQLIKGDSITNPEYAKKVYHIGGDKFSYVDYKNIPKGDIEIEISTNNQNSFSNQNSKKMEHLIKLASSVNFSFEGDLKPDSLIQFITDKLKDNLDNEKAYATEIKNLKSEKTTLEASLKQATDSLKELEDSKSFIEVGKNHLEEIKNRTENLYKTLKGEDADESMLTLIKEGDPKVVNSLLKDYQKQFDELNPLACKDCNSQNISRCSADGDGGASTGKTQTKSNMEVIQNRKKKNFSVNRIHGDK